jgi:hypothetical protein
MLCMTQRFATFVLVGAVMAILGASVAGPAPGATIAHTYVALGDSYASGEGLGDYAAGTDVSTGRKRNVCHRSSHAFSQISATVLPAVQDRGFWACSGATSTAMLSVPTDQYQQPRQTDQVGSATQWISLFAGGDDLDFGPIGISCAEAVSNHRFVVRFSGTSCSSALSSARAKRPTAQAHLAQLYTKLLANAPKSALVVMGYPRILPALYDGVPKIAGSDFCVLDHYPTPFGVVDVGMPVTDAKNVDQFVTDLNDTVQSAVDQVKAQLGGNAFRIRYVDNYTSSVPHNCKGTTPGATVSAFQISAGQGIGGNLVKLLVSTATFHPTKVGQQLLADNAEAAFEDFDPVIATTALPAAIAGRPYQTELATADNRSGSWQITNGSLPDGLSLTGATISGTPTTPGQVVVSLRFTDSTGRTATADVNLIVEPAPSDVDVERPSGFAGFASYVHNIPCPTPSPGRTMWVYGEGAGYTPGEFENGPQQLTSPTNSLLVRSSWNAAPGTYTAHVDCIEGSAASADGGATVKRINFTQTVTGPASHLVITPDPVTPGGRMQISGGAGCGIDTNGFNNQVVSLVVYLPDSLAGFYIGDGGTTAPDATWAGPIDYPVPTQARTKVNIDATCSSNGDRGGAYFYPEASVSVG